jgi:predicted site-specific integrase-resolvase
MYYKLSDYAKKFNVTYKTAWNHYKSGKIDGAFLDERTNRVYIPVGSFNENKTKKVALYARVSNNDAKDNLDRQLERIRNYSISNDLIKDIADDGDFIYDLNLKGDLDSITNQILSDKKLLKIVLNSIKADYEHDRTEEAKL